MSSAAAPAVSAVIPTRGRPELVARAVKSALNQTWRDLEVVVVVDGPDPATVAALLALGDDRVRVIPLEASVGGSQARNLGAAEARGAWIALLDDDDEWLPHKIAVQMAAVAGQPGNNTLIASLYYHRAPGAEDVIRPRRLPAAGESIVEFMFDYLCYFQTSTLVCSADLIRRIPFQPQLPLFQDMDWFLRVNSDDRVRFVISPQPLSIYYEAVRRPSITSKTGWLDRLAWGRERLALLGPRAYSRFVVGSCASRAAEDGAGLPGFRRLFYETVFVGSATPKLVALLTGAFLVTPRMRKRLRDALFLKKRPGAAVLTF
jgi:glycosyltransferase involved in cell wall biosynthesis